MARGQIALKRLTEDEARDMFEGLRWANGRVCPHCGNCDQVRITKMEGEAHRDGLYNCMECRKQFTVTVGTVMERSKVALRDWVYVFAAVCASKKGISALQISRELGCQYKTAWFMCHRVRLAMRTPAMGMLVGTVTADETFVGGKPRHPGQVKAKMPVLTLVEKGGRARTRAVANVTARTLRKHLVENIDSSATLMTDEYSAYKGIGKHFAAHRTVNHSHREYVSKSGATSNDAESYFALLKRGVYGTFHNISAQHLQRYCDEFDFRWSNREVNDTERTYRAMAQTGGKRLMYRKPEGANVN